jgi:hypothetical protein
MPSPRALTHAVPLVILGLFAVNLMMVFMHVFAPPLPEWAARGSGVNRGYLWDMTRERTIPTWWSALQLALIGGLLLGFAAARPARRSAVITLAGTGLLFCFLSADEFIGLHEIFARYLDHALQDRSDTTLNRTGPWMLILAPLFLAALALAHGGRDLLCGRRKVQLLYVAGIAVFLASAAGLEFLANWTGERYFAAIEEAGEMMGATLVVWATYELIRSHGFPLFARVPAEDEAAGPAAASEPRVTSPV